MTDNNHALCATYRCARLPIGVAWTGRVYSLYSQILFTRVILVLTDPIGSPMFFFFWSKLVLLKSEASSYQDDDLFVPLVPKCDPFLLVLSGLCP